MQNSKSFTSRLEVRFRVYVFFECFNVTVSLGSFTAESEREKKEWMEALQESIAETLSDYEVAEKIWSNRSNRACADCKAYNPDWASINLCVIICKNCAGQSLPQMSSSLLSMSRIVLKSSTDL